MGAVNRDPSSDEPYRMTGRVAQHQFDVSSSCDAFERKLVLCGFVRVKSQQIVDLEGQAGGSPTLIPPHSLTAPTRFQPIAHLRTPRGGADICETVSLEISPTPAMAARRNKSIALDPPVLTGTAKRPHA